MSKSILSLPKNKFYSLFEKGILYEPKPSVFKAIDTGEIVNTTGDLRRVLIRQKKERMEIARLRRLR